MRFWSRKSNSPWITDSRPDLKSCDLRTVVMIFGVWAGFAAAIHYAGSPSIYAAVDHFNHAINPFINLEPPTPPDHDALIVTSDHTTELTSVATLSPRGFHPMIAGGAKDALERVHAEGRVWKLVVIDSGLPGSTALTRVLREQLPGANFVAVQGRSGAQAVSRVLLERLSAPPRT